MLSSSSTTPASPGSEAPPPLPSSSSNISNDHTENEEDVNKLWEILKEGREDIEHIPLQTLREACAHRSDNSASSPFPSEFRPQLWKRFLNVRERKKLENVFDSTEEGGEVEEEKENRVKGKMVVSQLRNDVEQRGQLHNWSSSDVSAAQQILTQYCQSNAIAYQHEILMLLAPFMQHLGESEEDMHATSPMTMLEVYHCLSSFVQQFVPFLKSDTADHSVILKCFHLLFRLVLQYHDPQLSLHFDKHRIAPEMYILPWMNTLFTTQCSDLPVITSVWDRFILEGDSILPVFFGAAMLITRREQIMNAASESAILEQLNSINISEKKEALDMLLMAQELDRATPLFARNQMYGLMFPSEEANFHALHESLSANVVLSIPTNELVEAFRKNKLRHSSQQNKFVRYIIIDCRSMKSFNFARLPTAVHVGPYIGYDSKKMQAILDRFDSARGSHFTIFGTGKPINEENNLLKLIAMKFVADGFQHISTADGGFKDCIQYIVSNEIEYVRDEQAVEEVRRRRMKEGSSRLIDKETQEQLVKVASAVGDKVKSLWSWGKQVATEQGNKIREQVVGARSADVPTSDNAETRTTRVSSSDYVEPPKSAFSLDDDEDDDDGDTDLLLAAFTSQDDESHSQNESQTVKIEALKTQDENVKVFLCMLKTGKQEQPEQRYIAVGSQYILSVRAHPTMLGHGIVCWKRSLNHLLRLAYSKADKTSLTFVLRGRPEDVFHIPQFSMTSTFQESYRMNDAMDCVQHIQQCMTQLKRGERHDARNSDHDKEQEREQQQKQEKEQHQKQEQEEETEGPHER